MISVAETSINFANSLTEVNSLMTILVSISICSFSSFLYFFFFSVVPKVRLILLEISASSNSVGSNFFFLPPFLRLFILACMCLFFSSYSLSFFFFSSLNFFSSEISGSTMGASLVSCSWKGLYDGLVPLISVFFICFSTNTVISSFRAFSILSALAFSSSLLFLSAKIIFL